MATPFTDPRTKVIYFRRGVPEGLRPAFGGRAVVKISLRTKDAAAAKIAFAHENALFEKQLAEARSQLAEGTLVPTPAAIVRRWLEMPGIKPGLAASERLIAILMELDATTGFRSGTAAADPFPPAVLGPAANTDWVAVHADRERYDRILDESYDGNIERVGSNWIRARWYGSEWRAALGGPLRRLRAADPGADRFPDDDLIAGLLATLDEKRTGDEEVNRARLSDRRPRSPKPRLRPSMRLKALFKEWKAGTAPRPQSALEYEAAIDDFIDFAGDVPISSIQADILYDYRDAAARLPASMPRVDRLLPFRERVTRHEATMPKCEPPTLKKRVGAVQAMLTYAFQQRWIAANAGSGIRIVGYTKGRKTRRSFEDHELATLYACPLFTDPTSWSSRSRVSDATLFWLFLLAITTGARLEEVGQAALSDLKRDGDLIYLDIDDYALADDGAAKIVKTDDSIRLVPIHIKLIELGFLAYCDALIAAGHTQLFPDLRKNSVGKRTKEASQRINRIIDRHLSTDRRLVFHSLRHAFKAKGNDAGLSDRMLDQICGHAPISTGGRYGDEPRIRTISEALHRIDFSCIDWGAIMNAVANLDWNRFLKA